MTAPGEHAPTYPQRRLDFWEGRIIDAIHSSVPEELWPEILRKIDGPVAADAPADEFEDSDNAEDGYDPVETAQADEDGWTQGARGD